MEKNENYFEHDADIGIIGYGLSLEASFINGAEALFALMTNLTDVKMLIAIQFEFVEEDIELAFVTWLNLLIANAQANNLVFAHFEIMYQHNRWYGKAQGEHWRTDLERRIEVKGATLTMLSVTQQSDHWEAKCVVDV